MYLFCCVLLKKTGNNLEERGVNIVIFVLSLSSLVISLKLFWSLGEYADNYGSSPDLVTGGSFWLSMDWGLPGLDYLHSISTGV